MINYYAIITGAVLSMILGAIWYGPLFGKKWMEVVGADEHDLEARKEMQRKAMPLYGIQFVLVLFQVLVLAHLIADTTTVTGLVRSLWVYAAFVVPTLAGASMWTAESGKQKWSRFLIQAGYQLLLFVVFGLLLQYWQ